jgi:hypothetical protein
MIRHDRSISLCCDDQAKQVITDRHENIWFGFGVATGLGHIWYIRARDAGCRLRRVYRREAM